MYIIHDMQIILFLLQVRKTAMCFCWLHWVKYRFLQEYVKSDSQQPSCCVLCSKLFDKEMLLECFFVKIRNTVVFALGCLENVDGINAKLQQ